MVKIERRFKFKKEERLKGTKRVDAIFTTGKSFISYPLRVLYLMKEQSPSTGCSILISVPKKRIKKAVHRNRIKRLIRESYRLNRTLIDQLEFNEYSIDVALIYVKDSATNFNEIDKAIKKALNQIAVRIKKIEESE
jgi:ribonuclease P protein component